MKLSFSTVGCPKWSWGSILSTAVDLGYAGIELRGLGDDLFLPDVKYFRPDRLAQTCAEIASKQVTIACLATDTYLFDPEQDAVAALTQYIELAAALGAPGLRVLGDAWGHPGEGIDRVLVESRLRELIPIAQAKGVGLWVETNGVWAESARLRGLLERLDAPVLGVVWDIHHPFRYFNEAPEWTMANIGRWVRHVHVKDSVMAEGKPQFKMLGYGDLPVQDCLRLLAASGYDGFLSMEWVKRWNNELEDAGIVFPHYAYQMRRYGEKL